MLWIAMIQTFNMSEIFRKEMDELFSSLNSLNSSEKSSSSVPLSISTRNDMDEGEGTEEEEENDKFEMKKATLKSEVSPSAYHFARTFATPPQSLPLFQPQSISHSLPHPISTISLPSSRPLLISPPSHILRFTAVLGGNVRNDKFSALDHLIDTVSTCVKYATTFALDFIWQISWFILLSFYIISLHIILLYFTILVLY